MIGLMHRIELGFDKAALEIDPDSRGSRIYAPIAYPVVRQAQFVPIAYGESLSLAAFFPIVWLRNESDLQLVVIRTFLAEGKGQPPGSPRSSKSLPLVLRGYPFRLEYGCDTNELASIGLDGGTPDEPTDAGSPILLSSGQPSRGTEQRCRALALFARALPDTRAMTEFLASRGLLSPWPLKLTIAGEEIEINTLEVVRPSAFGTGALAPFVHRFAARGARFVAAHRLSLFRAGSLANSARIALTGG